MTLKMIREVSDGDCGFIIFQNNLMDHVVLLNQVLLEQSGSNKLAPGSKDK